MSSKHTDRKMYVARCTEDDCGGGDDLPVEGLGPMGPYLLGEYHADATGHNVDYSSYTQSDTTNENNDQ